MDKNNPELILKHSLRRIKSLTPHERECMLSLLMQQFDGIRKDDFNRDLEEKDSVMVLMMKEKIIGFSTLMNFPLKVKDQIVRVIFSGDTVVLPQYRSSMGFTIEISRYFLQTGSKYPHEPLFWILISKGPNTYRILPAFFKIYYPMRENIINKLQNSMTLKDIADAFGYYKFPSLYDPSTGLIRHSGETQRLRKDTPEAQVAHNRDNYTEYFIEKNKLWLAGDELVCVARVARDNFTCVFQSITNSCYAK